jgi:hypothetical protein
MKEGFVKENFGSLSSYTSLANAVEELLRIQNEADKGEWIDIEVRIRDDYGDPYVSIEGYRPETRDEKQARADAKKSNAVQQKERDLKELERLKKLYEGK